MRKKRFIAGVLFAALLISSVPAAALADGQDGAVSAVSESGAEAVSEAAEEAAPEQAAPEESDPGQSAPEEVVPEQSTPGPNTPEQEAVTEGQASDTKTENGAATAPVISIFQQPEDVTAGLNATIHFTVGAENVAAYQWFYSKNGTTWNKSTAASAKTDTMEIKVSTSNSSNVYKCKLTDAAGNSVFSEPAKINLIPGVKIKTQPKSPALKIGSIAHLEVVADNVDESNPKGYQWQYSKDGKSWFNSSMTGCNSPVVEFKVTTSNRNNQYRCAMMGIDGNKKNSSAVGFVILTKEPVSSTAANGQTATFSLTAEDEVLEYQWQYSKDEGETWYSSTATGAKTDTLSFTAKSTNRGNLYRCKMTKENGVIGFSAEVGFLSGPKILAQPQIQKSSVGKTVVYAVEAENIASYQWQYSKDGKSWYSSTAATAKTSALSVKLTTTNMTNKYRCKMTGLDNSILYTDVVYAEQESSGGEGESGTETGKFEFRSSTGAVLAQAEKVRLGSNAYYEDGDVIWIPRAEIEKDSAKVYTYYGVMKDGSRVLLNLNGVVEGASGSYAEVRLFFYVPEGLDYITVE